MSSRGVLALLAQARADGLNVTLVDMHPALSLPTDFHDGVHPDDSGCVAMAGVWLPGLRSIYRFAPP